MSTRDIVLSCNTMSWIILRSNSPLVERPLLLMVTVLLLLVDRNHQVTSSDYCLMESFNATCRQPNEVVVVERARYGRMAISRCVTGNYGHLGCFVDVRRVIDSKCSGRRSCRVGIPDPDLYATRPCPGDFTSYLEATYRCQHVEMSDVATCQRHRAIRIAAGRDGRPASGFLASVTTEEFGFGSSDCPWIVETRPGQRINLTLLNYASVGTGQPGQSSATAADAGAPTRHSSVADLVHRRRLDVCFEVAVVSESPDDRRTVSVCSNGGGGELIGDGNSGSGGELSRDENGGAVESIVAVSRSNELRIEVINRHMLRSIGAFMLHYKVFGCPTLRSNSDYWYRRDGDSLVVGCNATTDTWYLVCKNTLWVGEVGNCSTAQSGYADWKFDNFFNSEDTFSVGLLLVVSIGVAMGIVVGGLLLCIVTMLSKRNRNSLASTLAGTRVSEKRPVVLDLTADLSQQQLRTSSRAGQTAVDYGVCELLHGDSCVLHHQDSTSGCWTAAVRSEPFDDAGVQLTATGHGPECCGGGTGSGIGVVVPCANSADEVEFDSGLRWAAYHSSIGGCQTVVAAGSSTSNPAAACVASVASPLSSFRSTAGWTAARTHLYEMPQFQ